MIYGKKISIVLPAYNAEKTLEKTYNEIPFDIVDQVILVDDLSKDQTVEAAEKLGIQQIIPGDIITGKNQDYYQYKQNVSTKSVY